MECSIWFVVGGSTINTVARVKVILPGVKKKQKQKTPHTHNTQTKKRERNDCPCGHGALNALTVPIVPVMHFFNFLNCTVFNICMTGKERPHLQPYQTPPPLPISACII